MQPRRLVLWVAWLLAAGCALAQPGPSALLQAPRVQASEAGNIRAPAPQPEPDCDAAFRSALGTCWTKGALLTPGSACCTALGQLTPSCLQTVSSNLTANASNTAVAPTLDRVLLSCNLTAQPLGNATVPIKPSPYLTNGSSPAFPLVGDMRTAWVLDDGPVACPQYNAVNRSWVLDPAAPTWGPSSSRATPSDEAVLTLADPLCAQPSDAGAAMAAELAAGGERAQVLVSALWRTSCVYGTDLLKLLQSDPRLLNPATALSYIEAFVRAADQVGVGACVTAAVLLNSTGAVQAWAQMHTLSVGPPLASLSSTGSSGGTYGSSGGGSGSTGNSSSSEVPSGSAESSWVLTLDTAECSTFTPPYGWQDDTQAWAGQGGTEVPEGAAEDLAIMLCGSPATVSGEALYAAFSQGGEAAEVAVAALLAYECPSGDSDAILDAAFRAFTQQDALYDADTAYRVASNFVEAAVAVGAGACVSIAVLDEQGSLLEQVQLHTSVDSSADGSNLTYSQRLLGGTRTHRSLIVRRPPT